MENFFSKKQKSEKNGIILYFYIFIFLIFIVLIFAWKYELFLLAVSDVNCLHLSDVLILFTVEEIYT